MLFVFNNEADNLSWGLQTKINLGGDTEDDLNKWMQKNRRLHFYSSKMIKLPNFPGRAYEIIRKESDEYITFELYYNSPLISVNIPSFQMDFVIGSKYNMGKLSDYWKIIIQNFKPLQSVSLVE